MSLILASTITKACFAWMLFYVVLGASESGKAFISSFVSSWVENSKGGVPLVMLIYPVLIAASVCALCNVRSRSSQSRKTCLCPPNANRWQVIRKEPFRSIMQRLLANHGDGNFDWYAWIFLLVPLSIYAFFGIHRRMVRLEISLPKLLLGLQTIDDDDDDDDDTASEMVMGIGNALGMTAVVSMAFFLIPTSKHGPILKLFGWSHASAIRLHIWCGRLLVVTALLHGMFHSFRWKYQLGEDVQAFLFPPRQCWTSDEAFAPTCKNPESDCTCYDHFLYFTGTCAALCLIVIAITSSHWVRRKSYAVFLTSHLLAGPLFLLGVMFHYHSAILYMAPSLLYYLATSLPPYLERRRNVGVHIVSVDVIGGGGGTTASKYVSLTLEATRETVKTFRPGMYTKLSVPSISHVAHPFTINRVPGHDDQLRVLFRVTGPFTRQLAVVLEAESGIPTIHLDGLHGCPSRMQQLQGKHNNGQHDVNVMVAGGVGVTPFLSLIGDAVNRNGKKDGTIIQFHDPNDQDEDDGLSLRSMQQQQQQPQVQSQRRLALHWICRDASLIDYVRREYLDPLKGRATPACDTQIHIHHTGRSSDKNSEEDEEEAELSIRRLTFQEDTIQVTEPFRISRFAPSARIVSNLGPFLALMVLLWPGLALIWYCYTHLQEKTEIRGRGFAPLFLGLYTVAASYVLARVLPYAWFGKSSSSSSLYGGDCKIRDDSDHSLEELLPLSHSPSAGHLAQTMDDTTTADDEVEEENPNGNHSGNNNTVTLECHTEGGRPDLEVLLEAVDNAQWPAIYSCGPAALSQALQRIANEKSQARSAVEPTQSSPLVTIYDEVFRM